MKKIFSFCIVFLLFTLQIIAQTPEEKLKALNIELPTIKPPIANYVHCVRTGNLLFLSGKGPSDAKGNNITGKVGKDLTVEIGSKDNDILRGVLSGVSYISKIENRPFGLSLSVKQGFGAYDLSQLVFEKGIVLTHLVEKKRSLEQEFLQITASK